MIRIIKGVYGYLNENGVVKPKTPEDKPFELTKEQEARLVGLGVAEYVEAEAYPIGFDEQPPEDIEEDELRKPLDEMSVKELRELGKEYGLSFKVGMSKEAMKKAILDKWENDEEAAEAAEDDGEELPDFDPSEAVQ